jgi:hypothetical protein
MTWEYLGPAERRFRKILVSLRSQLDLEHRMGFEPMNTGFADQRVSHFAIGAITATLG